MTLACNSREKRSTLQQCSANQILAWQVKVKDRGAITTADAETRVVLPAQLQPRIDAVVAGYPAGVCWLRVVHDSHRGLVLCNTY